MLCTILCGLNSNIQMYRYIGTMQICVSRMLRESGIFFAVCFLLSTYLPLDGSPILITLAVISPRCWLPSRTICPGRGRRPNRLSGTGMNHHGRLSSQCYVLIFHHRSLTSWFKPYCSSSQLRLCPSVEILTESDTLGPRITMSSLEGKRAFALTVSEK